MISLRSRVVRKVLSFYYLNPQESLFVNELARRLSLDKRNLVKKLRELELAGFLLSEKRGNLKFYRANEKFPLYREYKTIVLKTIGVEERLKQILRTEPGIKEAYLYGSYAREKMNAYSDLDVLIVGDHKIVSLQKKINLLQSEIGREVNCVHMSDSEFRRRKRENDPFLSGVFGEKTIKLV